MTDERNTPPGSVMADDGYYEETVVEYVDTGRRRTVLAVILVLLVLLLVGVGYFIVRGARPAGAPAKTELPEGVSWIRSLYSWGPDTSQALSVPTAVAVAPDGTIWTLANKQYIVGFSPAGQVRHVIAPTVGRGSGQIISLEGLAVGDEGSIYVTDFGNNRVDVFSSAGQFLRSWDVQLPQVVDVRGDRVAVAASYGVGLFDTNGQLIAKWGSQGHADDQVDLPHGILIGSDNNIYLSDTQNRRLKAYDQTGRLLWIKADPRKLASNLMSTEGTVSIVGGVSQEVQLPCGLAEDANGRILMADAFTFEVVVVDPNNKGLITARYGEQGVQDGQFTYPTDIAFDSSRDTVMVADTSNNRVQIIRIPGTGGSGVRRVLKGLVDTPVWLCSVPLLLLLLALIVGLSGRRRARSAEVQETSTTPDFE